MYYFWQDFNSLDTRIYKYRIGVILKDIWRIK